MSNTITVFEHSVLRIDTNDFSLLHLETLQKFHSKNDTFFSLVHNGIRFKQFVGVLQVGNLTIEILPKMDDNVGNKDWRSLLISMLKYVWSLKIHSPTESNLSLHHSSILDLYIELFCREIEILVHKGLIKQYRLQESNQKALKGAFVFSKHITKNIVHKELFYVRSSVYDQNHILHQILFKALIVLKRLKVNQSLHSMISKILQFFPEQKDINVSEMTFDRIAYNRKTEPYRKAISIAKLILLQFHPDVQNGKYDVLALLFDMNKLWEAYLTKYLQRKQSEYTVVAQKNFPFTSEGRNIKPDILLQHKCDKSYTVLDAKWKKFTIANNVAIADLYQIYAYGKYFSATKAALVYPKYTGDDIVINFDYKRIDKNVKDFCGSIIAVGDFQVDLRKTEPICLKGLLDWLKSPCGVEEII